MPIFVALLCIFLGGLVNGSFALPTKYIQQWRFENIWLNYAIWALLLLPWISIFVLAPNVWTVYQHIPANLLWILIAGGALFGIGQTCFALSLGMIGFGLGFVINIGLGTALGFLMPLLTLHPEKIFTAFGGVTLCGIGLIIIGLMVSYHAGKRRDAETKRAQPNTPPRQYQQGVILAVAAGICSAIQNFTFATTGALQSMALHAGLSHLASSMIIWPVFLTFSFIPYALYMIYLHQRNQSFTHYKNSPNSQNGFLTLMMALCWYSSLVLYSMASLLIGKLGPVIGWPLFMVLIILVSNFWGWRNHEWAHVTAGVKQLALSAIGLLLLAVFVLAYSATLT
jgi:L-rhamnose-H+ transport protein